jgi:hypothetical protein
MQMILRTKGTLALCRSHWRSRWSFTPSSHDPVIKHGVLEIHHRTLENFPSELNLHLLNHHWNTIYHHFPMNFPPSQATTRCHHGARWGWSHGGSWRPRPLRNLNNSADFFKKLLLKPTFSRFEIQVQHQPVFGWNPDVCCFQVLDFLSLLRCNLLPTVDLSRWHRPTSLTFVKQRKSHQPK